jgi:hypothetical protein
MDRERELVGRDATVAELTAQLVRTSVRGVRVDFLAADHECTDVL